MSSSSSSVVNTAPIKWAQRADSLYLTIAIPDVKDETIELSDQELHFKGSSEGKEYQVNIEFYQAVDSEHGSTYKVLPRSVQMHVMKKKTSDGSKKSGDDEFWPRLLKDKQLEKNQVKLDWDRYVDPDDADEAAAGFDMSALEGGSGMRGMPPGMGGMGGGMPGMGGMGGMPGMGGMGGMPGMGGMGGMGGMADMFGGAGGADMEKLMQQMGQIGGGADDGDYDDEDDGDDDENDLDDDDLPDLEEKK